MMAPNSALRRRVSNRTLIGMCERAGCEVLKVHGAFTQLRLPNGRKFSVASAHTRNANSHNAMKELEQALGGTEKFWAFYDPETDLPELEAAAAKLGRDIPDVKRHDSKTGAIPAPPTRKETPVEPTGTDPQPIPTSSRRRGASNEAFAALVRLGGTGSIEQIMSETGMKRQQAAAAGHYLVTQGIATRVKTGIYQLTAASSPHDQRIQVDVEGGTPVSLSVVRDGETAHAPTPPVVEVPAAAAYVAPVAPPSPQSVPVPPPLPLAPEVHEETIVALVDVLFPNGLKITGRNLAALDQWRAATARLLTEVEA